MGHYEEMLGTVSHKFININLLVLNNNSKGRKSQPSSASMVSTHG